MIFGGYFFAHVFKFSGATPSACYIDFKHAGEPAFQKTLAYSVPSEGWVLELQSNDTLSRVGQRLEGDLVVVVNGMHTPVSRVVIEVRAALTAMRP